MSLPFAFWDASALIPLCVLQIHTPQARVLYLNYAVVVWWTTPVEIVSGLTRLKRMSEIDQDEFLIGKQRALDLARIWMPIEPTSSIAARACSLLELYPLRAADALQLSAALNACEDKPQSNVFITADQRLADAARQSGFSVEYI
jgi:predicted nucleic acid-binding protein